LQKSTAQKLQADERDALRAAIIRGRLEAFPKPDLKKSPEKSEKPDAGGEKSA
jgi:hypothetical protein